MSRRISCSDIQKSAQTRLTTGGTPPGGQHHLCEEAANKHHEAKEECGLATAIPRELPRNNDNCIQGSSMKFVPL